MGFWFRVVLYELRQFRVVFLGGDGPFLQQGPVACGTPLVRKQEPTVQYIFTDLSKRDRSKGKLHHVDDVFKGPFQCQVFEGCGTRLRKKHSSVKAACLSQPRKFCLAKPLEVPMLRA